VQIRAQAFLTAITGNVKELLGSAPLPTQTYLWKVLFLTS